MPFYDFRCTVCGHEFEEMQPMDAPNPPCPVMLENAEGGKYSCEQPTVKVPSRLARVDGAHTPIFYPNRGAR